MQTLAGAGELAGISLVDPGTPTLTVTAAQYTNDAGALGLIGGSYNVAVTGVLAANAASVGAGAHVAAVSVSDTGANVVASLSALQGLGTELAGVALTDGGTPTLAVTATQYAADAGAIAKITGSYNLAVSGVLAANAAGTGAGAHVTAVAVSDTGANVAANLGALQGLGTKLPGIALTDTGTPTLAITSAQLAADATALGKIAGSYNLGVSGVLAASAASTAGTAHVTSVAVSDTAAHVVTSIAALETLAVAARWHRLA